jgi:hypothetical protein
MNPADEQLSELERRGQQARASLEDRRRLLRALSGGRWGRWALRVGFGTLFVVATAEACERGATLGFCNDWSLGPVK